MCDNVYLKMYCWGYNKEELYDLPALIRENYGKNAEIRLMDKYSSTRHGLIDINVIEIVLPKSDLNKLKLKDPKSYRKIINRHERTERYLVRYRPTLCHRVPKDQYSVTRESIE